MMDQNQREAEKHDKKMLANFMLIMIILTLIFMMVISWTHIKINNDIACGRDNADLYRHDLAIQNSTILDTAGEYALMRAPFNKTVIVGDYEFCIYAIASENTLNTHIIDQNETILANIYLDNTTTRFCSNIDYEDISDDMYIGVMCDDCNSTYKITLQESILGSRQRIEGISGSITISEDHAFAYDLYWADSCRPILKYWVGMYIILMTVFIFLIVLLIGLSRMSAWILNFEK